MNASEKLTQLIDDGRLTEEQLNNLNDWGIQKVSYLRGYLIDKIHELKNEAGSIDYKETAIALYKLLNYNDDEFVIYDYNGVQGLDFDTLNDVLD